MEKSIEIKDEQNEANYIKPRNEVKIEVKGATIRIWEKYERELNENFLNSNWKFWNHIINMKRRKLKIKEA